MTAYIGALLQHMRRDDGPAVRALLEDDGVFDDPELVRALVVQMGCLLLDVIGEALGGYDALIDEYPQIMTAFGHAVPSPCWGLDIPQLTITRAARCAATGCPSPTRPGDRVSMVASLVI